MPKQFQSTRAGANFARQLIWRNDIQHTLSDITTMNARNAVQHGFEFFGIDSPSPHTRQALERNQGPMEGLSDARSAVAQTTVGRKASLGVGLTNRCLPLVAWQTPEACLRYARKQNREPSWPPEALPYRDGATDLPGFAARPVTVHCRPRL